MSQIPIQLFCRAYCDAILSSPITEEHLGSWSGDWKPHFNHSRKSGNPQPDESWDWKELLNLSNGETGGYTYAITAGDKTQGLMWITRGQSISNHPAKLRRNFLGIPLPRKLRSPVPILHVERLTTAPWNRGPTRGTYQTQYKLVGEILLRSAVIKSIELGMFGRIGLHALPGAESFYEKLGMTKFHSQQT